MAKKIKACRTCGRACAPGDDFCSDSCGAKYAERTGATFIEESYESAEDY